MSEEVSNLGRKLTALRNQRGMSQYRVATDAEIPQSTLSRLEKGIIKNLNTDSIKRLASALRTSTDFLLGESESSVDLSGKSTVYERVLDAVMSNTSTPMLVMALDGLICYSNLSPGRIGEPFEKMVDPADWIDLQLILEGMDVNSSPVRTEAIVNGEPTTLTLSPAPTPLSSGKGEHLAFVIVNLASESDHPATDSRGQVGSLARIAQRLSQKSKRDKSDIWGLVAREICQGLQCNTLSILSNVGGAEDKVAVHSWDNNAGYEVETDAVPDLLSSRNTSLKEIKKDKGTIISQDTAFVPLMIDSKVAGVLVLMFSGLSEEEILGRLSQHSPLILQVSLAVDFARD